MTVKLLHHTPITNVDLAISRCWDKPYDADNFNETKVSRIVNKFKHESTVEHLMYQFDISGVSRALLQEQSRHRLASYSVESSRYTLGRLKDEDDLSIMYYTSWDDLDADFIITCSKYLVWTGVKLVDLASIRALGELQLILRSGISNDRAKYCLPEALKTQYIMTINARSLRNLLSLRSAPSALWEFRDLAKAIYDTLPSKHHFLFNPCMAKPEPI